MAPISDSLRIRLQIFAAMLVPVVGLTLWLNAQGFFQSP